MRYLLLLAAAAAFAADAPKVINEGYGDFLIVPGGSFKMGDNFGDGEPRDRDDWIHHLADRRRRRCRRKRCGR